MLEDFNPQIFYYVSKRCDRSWSLTPPARIPFNDLTFILQGEAVYWLEGTPFTVHAGEAVFIPEGMMRAAKTEGMECMAFNFFSNIILDEVLPPVSTFRDCAAVDYWLREYNRAWLTSRGSLKGKAAFLMLFGELFQRNAKNAINPHVEKMKQCIADHLTEPFSLDRIAQCVHLHPVYCESLFREYIHCTPAQYQTQLRMAQAAVLLAHEGFSISHIAEQLGYEDASYFSRVFKKFQGMSPNAYRRMTRKNMAP